MKKDAKKGPMGKAEAGGSPSRRRLYRSHATRFRESCLHNFIPQRRGRHTTSDPALDLQSTTTLANSASTPSPVVFTMRPECSLLLGSTRACGPMSIAGSGMSNHEYKYSRNPLDKS